MSNLIDYLELSRGQVVDEDWSLTLVAADELDLAQQVLREVLLELRLRCARSQRQWGVQRIEFEEVAMRRSRRRTGSPISDAAKIVDPLYDTVCQLCLRRHMLR